MNAKTKIVIVEDDSSIRLMYEYRLEAAGYEVKSAPNGLAGLELIEVFLPALILLDIKMPILSGDLMLQRLRATNHGALMRVIILTNISKDEAPKSLRLLNVDRYIVKAHVTPHQITDIIKEVLKQNPQF